MSAMDLPVKTYIYFLAQSINLTTAVMSVTMAALVGTSLTPQPWLSTVPYGFQFLFVMLSTFPASRLMAKIGRKKSFLLSTLPLAASGIAGYLAVENRQFPLLVLSHSLLGIYIAFANFNRFAATDNISANLKPQAISLVVAGGVVAAILGPLLTKYLKDSEGMQTFSACYLAFTGLAALSFLLNLMVKNPITILTRNDKQTRAGSGLKLVCSNRTIIFAITVAAIGYGIMNLLMIQASLHMSNIHVHFSGISSAIQWHVLAMFGPSFFTGIIIQRVGLKTVVMGGIILIFLSSLINITASDYYSLSAALITLGLGWNFTYVGGSALLTQSTDDASVSVEL